MNDATPIRLGGSLLERAWDLHGFVPPPIPHPAPALAPAPAPRAVPIAADTFELRPAHRVADGAVAIDRGRLAAAGMIVPGAAATPIAEEFRAVKRQLLATARSLETAAARAVLVCSPRPDDGKTFCAINLALSLAAEADTEVVLVDADFAKPDILPALGIDAGGRAGVLDALADPVRDVEALILDTDVPGLRLLPAGTRHNGDTELLASARAGAMLRDLATANARRIVVYDSPPALMASPAGVLAAAVGQVMMVVRADVTSESDLRAAVAQLDTCEHIRLLLNAVRYRAGGPDYGRYGEDAA